MDPIFLAELVVVGLIILLQFGVFFRNLNFIGKFGKLFPEAHTLDVEEELQADEHSLHTQSVPQLKSHPSFSVGFQDILSMTNAYLSRNKGSSQGERLQEIAERKSDSMEGSIETNLPLPLYIGLLATFTGVIIGLIKIGFEGVSDAAIQSFIGGVVVGMIGSATGLLLTVRSNSAFKKQKEANDEGMEDYFQFLRTKVFHPEAAPVQGSVRDLRESLASFQEGFANYQGQMNQSLAETLRLFGELKDVFKQIRSVEQEIRGLGNAIQANDGLVEKQVRYMENYSQKAEEFARKLGNSFGEADRQLEALVEQNIKTLDNSSKAAYMKMDQYLSSLEGGDSKAFARNLSDDLSRIKEDIKNIQERSLEVNVQLLDRLAKEEISRKQLSGNLDTLTKQMAGDGTNPIMKSGAVQAFVYTGIVAFVLGIAGGAIYLFQFFTA